MNPGNMGMYTVDRAIIELFGEKNHNVSIFCAHPPFKMGYYKFKKVGINIGLKKEWSEGKVTKKSYGNPQQLNEFERIVFWGDFTLNPEYCVNDFADYDVRFGISADRGEAIKRWRNIFSTRNFSGPEIITFGQNFLHETLSYGNEFFGDVKYMLSGTSLALPRDSKSTENIKSLGVENCTVIQACDPAMLKILKHEPRREKDFFVYYFSRSILKNADELISSVSKKLNLEARELKNWNRANEDYEDRWKNLSDLIKESRFLITDTYHCAVNAISLHKIPLVISNPSASQSGTLGDFKKKVLLEDCRLSDYHFESDEANCISTGTIEATIGAARELLHGDSAERNTLLKTANKVANNSRQILFEFLDFAE